MEHNLEKHTNCERPYCHICEGGLAHCLTCGGAEGSLPTECPGRRLTTEELDWIYKGVMDYHNGMWWMRSVREAPWVVIPNAALHEGPPPDDTITIDFKYSL